MLYLRFQIGDLSKFRDFQVLYQHMVQVRQPGFQFEKEEVPEIDWEALSPEELETTMERFANPPDPAEQRYEAMIPDYVKRFFEAYSGFDSSRYGMFGFQQLEIFNYLEFGFEVQLDKLEACNEQQGVVEFSTGNYPFGGLDRFLITLRAHALTPTEGYNGFNVIAFEWISDFDYEVTELPEKTEQYLAQFKNR